MISPAAAERAQLCDLFLELGPDAPTLSGAWTTRDLAAHLVVRERRPDAGPGILVTAFASYSEQVRRTEAERPYEEIVERVRKGPPLWSPTRLPAVDRLVNTVEFFVHHEDVRRGGDDGASVPARHLPAALTDTLTEQVSGPMGRMVVRACPGGLAVEPDGAPRVVVKRGEPTVTVAGPIGEIVLFLYGRGAVAHVDLDGEAGAIAAVRAARLGL
jgi:uncharacterized protein (TIGR03085 family)